MDTQKRIDRCLGRVKLKNNTYAYATTKRVDAVNRILGDKYSNNKKKKREEPKDWEETNEGQQWLASERRSSYSDRADNE